MDKPSRPVPVLMIPLRRCGSHALRLRLNFNPEFYAPYPLHIVDFMPLAGLYGDLSDDRTYFQLVVDVIGLQNCSIVKWPDVVFDPVEVFTAIKDEPRSIHRVVWELLIRAGEGRGARVVMDKSLDSVHYVDELLSLFSTMRFLNVVRDPRAQVNSMNKAIIHDFDPLLNALTWVKAHEAADLIMKRHPEKVMTVRYEDFIADQELALRAICTFFGLEFLPSMLDVSQSDEANRISAMSALWETNKFPPLRANVDKFKKSLSDEEIEVIETVCGDYMDRYGYEKTTSAARKITAKQIAAARKRSESNKRKAWQSLRTGNYQDYVLRRYRADYIDAVRARLVSEKRPVVRSVRARAEAAA